MNAIGIILLNFSEIRIRSLKIWSGIPQNYLNWKPDKEAFTSIEMIRHVLEAEHLSHKIIEKKGNLGNYQSPWEGLDYRDVAHELKIAEKYRQRFLTMIMALKESDLEHVKIESTKIGRGKKLGDYLNRVAYHEAVHAGQLLDYLRIAGINRPKVWE